MKLDTEVRFRSHVSHPIGIAKTNIDGLMDEKLIKTALLS